MGEYGEYVAQYVGDYAFQFSLALVALAAATAAWIVSRRRYVKTADFKRGIEALRFEFRRSIDEVRAATTRKAAGISDNLLLVIKQMDSSVTDLSLRLARLEEHADTVEAFMAGPQKKVLAQNEQIDARLRKLEQRLTALADQVSFLEQAVDGAVPRDQERNNSIEDINNRLVNTQKQVDERLELGEKARTDLGTLISLFVKQLKRVNINSVETAVRVAELERLRTKVTRLEERLCYAVDRDRCGSTGNSIINNDYFIGDVTSKAADDVVKEPNNGAENASSLEQLPSPPGEAPKESSVQVKSYSENGGADQHPA